VTRRRPLTLSVTIAALALALCCSGCGLSLQTMPQLGSSGGSGYPLHATFTNVQDLAPNAQVRYGDAVVGTVSSIKAHDYNADLTMRITKGTRLPLGTTAQVRFATPLGDEYVELIPPPTGGTGAMAPGTTLTLAQTSAAPTVADTLAALGAVLYGSGIGQVRDLVQEFNQILGPNHLQIQQLIDHLDTVLGSLANNDPHIDQALTAANAIVTQLNRGTPAIETALQTLPPAAAALTADNGQFKQLLAGINTLSPVAINVLQESGAQLISDMQQTVPVLQSLATVENSFGTDSALFTQVANAVKRDAPNGYVQLNVNFTATFPKAEPAPPASVLTPGCAPPNGPPSGPSTCPPGGDMSSIVSQALP
jgi:phospholipid/cholesterol/gamma-HCH transport system substrate-binding protein